LGDAIRAVPGAGLNVPVWLLGSSLFSAELAAHLGLPFAFASHFAPDYLMQALSLYRARFTPSSALQKPYAMACIGVFAAESDAEAQRLFTSLQQQFIALRRGRPGPLPPPRDSMEGFWSPMEQQMVQHSLSYSVVGDPGKVKDGIAKFIHATGVDELMVTAQLYDHAARVKSFEITAAVRDSLAAARKKAG
jgi:luciferase family oxidoreductase group 1